MIFDGSFDAFALLSHCFRSLDLASFASVQSFCQGLERLELLVCNAGLNSASAPQAPERQLSGDKVDVLYQSNFLPRG